MCLLQNMVVLKQYAALKREVRIGLANESNPQMGELSSLELNDISEIVSELDALIARNDPDDYMEWGVDLFSVLSYPDRSKCSDVIHNIDFEDQSTAHLLSFMRHLLVFKTQFSEPTVLKAILEKAFQHIKSDPKRFKKWDNNTYYETTIDGILILLNLSENDLQLTASEYVDQI